MNKKIKIPKEVWAQLENHPQMKKEVESLLDDEGRITVRDEIWNRQDTTDDKPDKIEWPKMIDLGLTIGDLLDILGKGRK